VATNDVHFIHAEDFEAHEARVCIGESRTLDDPRRDRRFSDQQHLRSAEEMIELFADIPEAVENTLAIARRCSVTVRMGEYFLPNYPVPEGMTMDDYFRRVSEEGLDDRLAKTLPKDDPDYDGKRQAYYDRLKFELDIIIQMGFPGYFLIVMDFIKWAKNNGVPVGPGRGSGAGSLVAYAQLITDLDPLQYDLLFERFLNPERVSMPDFDVDFCMEGRDRVIAYVAEKYGREAVSQIITFGTMAAKAVVRDVARVQGKSYGLADKLSKMIPFEVGMTLAKAVEQEPSLKEFLAQDEEAQEIWEMAIKLEGVCRNAGKHAGGVVIAPTKITDFSPLYCDDNGGSLVTQFDKNDVEDAGLVKFDFLGLRTLTIIDWALKMINPRREARGLKPLDISEIPLDDSASFVMLKKAETTAVFQLESRGMKDLIRRLQPDSLEDMIALVALFRPGPLQSGMVDDFIDRKHGKQPMSFPHPDYQYEGLKPVLEPTYGVILYQEQVMQIAQVMGGYSLGNADMLRRAMGKKKPEEMAKQKQFFLDGCAGNNIDKALAENIFDLVEKFAGYGFNKSHSAAYALVSYQTLWLKAHYTAEFMAAVLTADMQNTDKVVTLVEECRSLKLDLVLPDVSTSEYAFTANDDGQVVYGLGAIKGLGEGPIDSIVTAREDNGPFTDLFDFCRRVDLKKVNKRALEAMIRAGAMDTLGAGRAQLMASIEKAILQAGQQSRNEAAGMVDMFGDMLETAADANAYTDVADIREWPEKKRLKGEKDTLGLYLTGHPFDEYEREVRRFVRSSIADLKPNKSPQRVAGLVVAQRTMKTRTGSTMCFITLDDRSGRIEATLFSEAFFENRELLQSDQVIVVEGQVSHDDYSGQMKMRVNSVMGVASARRQFSRGLQLKLTESQLGNGLLDSLEQLLAPHRCEGSPVWIEYTSPAASTRIELGSSWRVEPNDNLLLELKYLVGDRSVELVYD
jgi:DNA polymerase-3 subunit alpha